MGEIKPFGLALGVLGNIMIAIGLYKVIANTGCAAAIDSPCSTQLGVALPLLFGGVIVSMAGMAFGGGIAIFLGIFLAVGIGALVGAVNGGDTSFGVPFGAVFAAVPVIILAVFFGLDRSASAKAVRGQNLVATGAKGIGTVVSVTDTGVSINDNPRVQIVMRVEPEDRTPTFDATKAVVVSRVAIPRAGDRFPVWYDRADPTQWVYGTDLNPGEAAPEVQALFARASAAVPQAAPVAPPDSAADELTKLADLHAKGILSDAEFAAAKARVLS